MPGVDAREGPAKAHESSWPSLQLRWVVTATVVLCLGAAATFISLSISRAYYSKAPYHYDSAAYRVDALAIHDTLQSQGLAKAAQSTLRTKDSLDILFRLFIAPDMLQHRYGHLIVLVPFMVIFMCLTAFYILKRGGRHAFAIMCPATLFVYQLFYNSYWGIADYWKDNLASWMLGIAIIAWLIAEDMKRPVWSALSGLMLGFLLMQRTCAGIYAAILFFPLVVWAVVTRYKAEGLRAAILRTCEFALPAAILTGVLLYMQGRELYDYYFIGGYGYGTPVDVFRFLVSGISPVLAQPKLCFFPGTSYGVGMAPLLLLPVYIATFTLSRGWSFRDGDINKALWCLVGLPAILIAASLYYYGIFLVLPVLLVALLATTVPRFDSALAGRVLAFFLCGSIALGATVSYLSNERKTDAIAEISGSYRNLLVQLGECITESGREDQAYATFFNETGAPFANHVRFDLGRKVGPPAVFITFHDQYFTRAFPGMKPEEIVAREMLRLENLREPIAVGHADLNNLYQPASDPIASASIRGFNLYLLNDPRWRVIKELPSLFGLLYVYRFVKA